MLLKLQAFAEEKVALQREIQIQKKLSHPNIIRLYSAEEKDQKLYIILEYMGRGTLFNYLMEQKDGFSENQALDYFKQMLKAMNYLHQNKILHRDLKPENILMGDNGQIKLCDFGFTAIFGDQIRVTKCGTREYMAPEMFQNQQQDDGVDIWSLGILLFELTHKSTPFPLNILFDFQRHYRRFKIPFKKNISPEVKDLISKILQYNPKKRPTANQILDLPLLQNIREENHDQDKQRESQRQDKIQQPKVQEEKKVIQKTYQSNGQVNNLVNPSSKFQDFYKQVTQTTTQKVYLNSNIQNNEKPLFNVQKFAQNYQQNSNRNFNEYGVKKPSESITRVVTSTRSQQRNYTPVPTYTQNNVQKSTSIQQNFAYRDNSVTRTPLNQNNTYQSQPTLKTNFANSHSGKFYNFNQKTTQQSHATPNVQNYIQNIYKDNNNPIQTKVYQNNNIYTQFQNPVQIPSKFTYGQLLQEEQPIQYQNNIYQKENTQRITSNQVDQPNKSVNIQIPFQSTGSNYIKATKRSYQPQSYTNGVQNTSDFPTYKNIVPHKSYYGVVQNQNGYRQTDLSSNYSNDLQRRINGIRQYSESRQKVKKISLNNYP